MPGRRRWRETDADTARDLFAAAAESADAGAIDKASPGSPRSPGVSRVTRTPAVTVVTVRTPWGMPRQFRYLVRSLFITAIIRPGQG